MNDEGRGASVNRSEPITVRLTEREKKRATQIGRLHGMKVSTYTRTILLDALGPESEWEDDSPEVATETSSPLCTCSHPKEAHQRSEVFGANICNECPSGNSLVWRHPYNPKGGQ